MSQPALNPDRLLSLFGDDPEARRMIWHHLQNTFNDCLHSLHQAHQGHQGQEAAPLWDRRLHELKGAAANIGAEELAFLAHNARTLPPTGDLAGTALKQLRAAFDRLGVEMQPLLD